MKNLEEASKDIVNRLGEVRSFILGERNRFHSSMIEKKGHNDLVSYVDRKAEEMIVNLLRNIFPGAGFITEENTFNQTSNDYNWIIDPLDGTTNFIHGMPCFCISIGLIKEKKPVLGIVYELNFDECFYAWENGGAFMNDSKISVSSIESLSDSLLATGFPYTNYERMKPYMEIFDYCMRNTHGLRRLGSAAADLAYVAAGRFEGFYEYGLNSWDVAGGALLVKEAGGIVTDFSGGENFVFGEEIIATNPHIASEFLNIVKEKFNS